LVIFDASTLILLAKIDLLQMVLNKYKGVIPEIVKEEVEYKEAIDTKVIIKQINDGRLIVNKNPDKNKIRKICKDFPLGKGEAAALVIANEKNDVLATDDGLAIKICKIFNVKFVTAIHFLIESGLDKSRALAKLDLLKKYGRYSIKITGDAEKRIIGR
jgi:predicted nucleic acid-binding protein